MSRRGTKRKAADLDRFDFELQDEKAANQKKCQEMLLSAAALEPGPRMTATETIAWALLKSGAAICSKLISIVTSAGHLGQQIVEKVLAEVAETPHQLENFKSVTASLMMVNANELKNFTSDSFVVMAPPVNSCFCRRRFLSGQVSFSRVTLCGLLKMEKNVLMLRLYCRKCSRSYTPWSADRCKKASENVTKAVKDPEPPVEEPDSPVQEPKQPVMESQKPMKEPQRKYYEWGCTKFIEANERVYLTKELCELFATLMSHTWTSSQGFAESYSEALHNFKRFEQEYITGNDDLLDRRTLSKGFFEYEIWNDLRESGKSERILDQECYLRRAEFNNKGVYDHIATPQCQALGCKWLWIGDGNWKLRYPLCLGQVLRQSNVHGITIPTNCTQEPCPGRAFCEEHQKLMSAKGWKTDRRGFLSQCAKKLGKQRAIKDMLSDVIQVQDNHEEKIEQEQSGTPATLDEAELVEELVGSDDEGDTDTEDKTDTPNIPVTRLAKRKQGLEERQAQQSAMEAVQKILVENGEVKDDNSFHGKVLQTIDLHAKRNKANCFKNVGGIKNLNQWLRGQFFIVSPCGHIYRWQPLYGSESPSQALLIMTDHLCHVLKDVPESEWGRCSMVYDNMCHVDDMRAARKPLPTHSPSGDILYAEPFNRIWLSINKAIDRLHISNHKDSRCHRKYNPDNIKKVMADEDVTDVKTMRAEETFVWMSRYKKILCAMPKAHHHVLLHRLIVRRNYYTYWKRLTGRSAMFPKIDKQLRNKK